VEHLIKVAAIGDATDVPFLLALKAEQGWSDSGREGNIQVVPLGRWVDTVCCFLQEGYNGLVAMARESAGAIEFCISVLEEIKTPQSVSALLRIGGKVIERPETDLRLAARLAGGFNLLLSFKSNPIIAPAVERQVRDFLHRLLTLKLTEEQQFYAVCALRGVGDSESLAVIAALEPFCNLWAGLQQLAVRQIKKRLRRGAEGG
jgi:hypothetical protein